MILAPSMVPDVPSLPVLSSELFPEKPANAPDDSPGEPFDSPRRVAARAAIEALQQASMDDKTLPAAETSVKSAFSEKHEVFQAHMATRTTSAPAGSVVVGAVHKYPTLNILLKGTVLMVSEHGKRMLVAPCMYMQAANTKKAGWVLEDCELTNVLLMPEAPETQEAAEAAVRAFHTVPNYNSLSACVPPAILDESRG